MTGRRLEANNAWREKKDYIKEALEKTRTDLWTLVRSTFVEKVNERGWRYRLDTASTYLKEALKDPKALNLSKDRATTVMALQIALCKAWYLWTGLIDAKWWSITRWAMQKFEREHGIMVSWYPTKAMVQKLLTVAEQKEAAKKVWWQRQIKWWAEANPQQFDAISQIDTTAVRWAFRGIWSFKWIEQVFEINNGRESFSNWKKYLSFLWKTYEESTTESSMMPSVPKNCYHNAWNYVIIGLYDNWVFLDGVKLCQWGIIEKGSFSILENTLENGERVYPNWTVEKWKFNGSADWALLAGTRTVNWRTTNYTSFA